MNEVKHIIIVDDDTAIQDAVLIMLEHKGYRVTVFGDGGPLLGGNFDSPDLFILDRQLPGVDGLDICRHLKEQATTKHIPVIVLSASPQIGNLAMAANADAFVEKPFKMHTLREMVEKLLSASKSD